MSESERRTGVPFPTMHPCDAKTDDYFFVMAYLEWQTANPELAACIPASHLKCAGQAQGLPYLARQYQR